jgi:hypothetical protein
MYDSGCAITFTAGKVTVKHGTVTILNGKCDPDSGLWRAPLEDPAPGKALPRHMIHNVYENKSLQDTIAYLPVCRFSPVQDTWFKAIENGHIANLSASTVDNVRKYLPKYDTMVKGHMNQIQQNTRSTQPKVSAPETEPDVVHEEKYHYVYVTVMETCQVYTDLTCSPPHNFSQWQHIHISVI